MFADSEPELVQKVWSNFLELLVREVVIVRLQMSEDFGKILDSKVIVRADRQRHLLVHLFHILCSHTIVLLLHQENDYLRNPIGESRPLSRLFCCL